MIRMVLAAAAAFALASAAPALACPSCHDCPMRAAAEEAGGERAGEADAERSDACACGKERAASECGEGCERCECASRRGEEPAAGDDGKKT